MSVEYRVVCAAFVRYGPRSAHGRHVWAADDHEEAVALAARFDERPRYLECDRFEVQARYLTAWDRLDVTEALGVRIEALERDGGPAPPVAADPPPNLSPPARTPQAGDPYSVRP